MSFTYSNEPFDLDSLLKVMRVKLESDVPIPLENVPEHLSRKQQRMFRLLELFLKFTLESRCHGDLYGHIYAVEYTADNFKKCLDSEEFHKSYNREYYIYLCEILFLVDALNSNTINMENVCLSLIDLDFPTPRFWNSFVDPYACSLMCMESFTETMKP